MDRGTRDGAARRIWYAAPIIILGAALAGFFYLGNGENEAALESGLVQIAGSETMRPVVSACAEAFMAKNPQADIIVKGGGSGDGIAALLHGVVDIGMSSRDFTQRERDYAASQGIELSVFELARDGIAIIVNHAKGVAALDLAEVADIFAGTVRDWREVGGNGGEIVVFARAAGSGTAALFDERVLGERPYAASVQHLPTNEAIVAEVASRPTAIGYTGLGALRNAGEDVKVVALRQDTKSAPVAPTAATIQAGTYLLSRTLYLGTIGTPSGTVKAFLDFCMSGAGKELVEKAGYVEIATATQ